MPRAAVLESEVGRRVQAQAPGGAQHERAQLDDQRREPSGRAGHTVRVYVTS